MVEVEIKVEEGEEVKQEEEGEEVKQEEEVVVVVESLVERAEVSRKARGLENLAAEKVEEGNLPEGGPGNCLHDLSSHN